MRIPRLPARPWVAVAAVVAAAAILLTVIHQGNANANTGPPGTPDNTLAHLIVPDGEEPRIRVSWDAPDAEVSDYTITRADGQTFSANGAATTFSDHTVEPGTTYAYSVAAHSAQGASPASESASADVPDTPSAPGNLTGAIAEPESTDKTATVNLTWAASTVPAADQCDTAYPLTGYTVVRSDGDQETELGTADAGATSFSDNTAAFSRQYTYRVTARNAIGASSSETAVSVFSQPVLPPTGLTATIADPFDGNVSLSWHAPTAGADIVGYMVFRYLGPDPYEGKDIPVTLDELATQTVLVDATAEAGVTYSYLVMAYSADNISVPSNTAAIEAPAAPSGLTTTAGDGAIELAWSAPTAGTAVEYRVARQQTDGDWTTLVDTTDSTHSDETAQPNVAYRYRVQHRNQYGGSTWTASEPVTLIAAPGKPTGLSAISEENDNILSWTAPDSPFIDGYRVRHRVGDGEWENLAEDLTETNYRHVDAQADVSHEYGVQAHNSAGNGPWSDTASSISVTPPGTPQNVSAQLDGDDIVLTWARPESVHVSGYTVRHRIGNAAYTESALLPENQTSHRLADATGDVTHYLGVKSHNDGGESEWSDDVEIIRLLPPAEPTGITATADDVNIVVSWTAPARGTVDGYHVNYGDSASEDWQTAKVDASATTFTHGDNVEGVTYRYRVRAHNSAGNGPWSTTETAVRILVPGVPTDVAAQVSGNAIVVTWTAPASGIVASYEVQFGVIDATTTTETQSVGSDETAFVHASPAGDTQYEYRVRSVNTAGTSDWSAPVPAMRVIPPPPPTGVTVEISGDDLVVSWAAPTTGIVDQYQVEHRQLGHENWIRETMAAQLTSYTHAGTDPGTTYQYRLRSVNGGGLSVWTEIVNGVWFQGAAPPSRIHSTGWGDRVLIRWADSVTRGVTGYQLRYRIDGGEWQYHTPTSRHFFNDWSDSESLHEHQARALINDQPGDWSAIQEVTIALPAAVTNVRANRESANGVRLHWDTPSSGTPALFRIEQRTGDQEFYRIATVNGHANTARIDHQTPGTTFEYRVRATNHVSLSGPYQANSVASVTMPEAPQQFDDMPSGLRITMTDRDTVKLTWDAPEQPGDQVTSYRIYRKLVSDTRRIGDSYTDHVLVPQTGHAGTVYYDYTVQPGVAYEYAVAPQRSNQNPPTGTISRQLAYATPW